jgi:hypothetical protein
MNLHVEVPVRPAGVGAEGHQHQQRGFDPSTMANLTLSWQVRAPCWVQEVHVEVLEGHLQGMRLKVA